MHPISDCQKIEFKQGAIYLGPSDSKKSVGYLELKPHSSLNLHNRPAIETLTQIEGESQLVLYTATSQGQIINLNEGESFTIKPAKTWHIHVNPYDEVSLTYWDFDGDVTGIIKAIQNSN